MGGPQPPELSILHVQELRKVQQQAASVPSKQQQAAAVDWAGRSDSQEEERARKAAELRRSSKAQSDAFTF